MKTLCQSLTPLPPFSIFSQITKGDLNQYISQLNPAQTRLFDEGECTILQWQDHYTFFQVRFDAQGKFLQIDREIWYEYPFPLFIRRVLLSVNNI